MSFLHGTEVIEDDAGPRPVPTVRTGVVGLVGTAAGGPFDVATLVLGVEQGAAAFRGGTLGDSFAAIYRQIGAVVVAIRIEPSGLEDFAAREVVGPGGGPWDIGRTDVDRVVVSNAAGDTQYVEDTDYSLDKATGIVTRIDGAGIAGATRNLRIAYAARAQVARREFPLVAGVARLDAEGRPQEVEVRSADGVTLYALNNDYTVDEVAGTVTRVAAGAIPEGATSLLVSYTVHVATAADVVGGVDPATGLRTGLDALYGAESQVRQRPKIIVAPGYSDQVAVANAMIGVADSTRGTAVIEGPATTDTEAIAYRNNFGSRRAYVVDPAALALDDAGATVMRAISAYVAGLMAKVDAEEGFWVSPSNHEIVGISGTSRPIDFRLGEQGSQANLLNEQEVATVIFEDGFRLWGNRTCSADPKFAFLNVARINDAINESILRAHLWAVDRNITRTYLEDVANSVQGFLDDLKAQGAILGGRCWPTAGRNTRQKVQSGQACFSFEFTPAYPAERVTFVSQIVDNYIEEIFDA